MATITANSIGSDIELNFTELAPNTKYKMYLHIQCDGTCIVVFIVLCVLISILYLFFCITVFKEIVLNQYEYWY